MNNEVRRKKKNNVPATSYPAFAPASPRLRWASKASAGRQLPVISTSVNPRRGFTLVEMVVYIAILVLSTILFINLLLSITTSYRTLKAVQSIHSSAVSSIDRMGFEIRGAKAVVSANSVFDAHPGKLVLTIPTSSGDITKEFYLDGSGILIIKEEGVDQGPLTKNNIEITSLIFRHLSATSSAIKIEMTIEGSNGKITKSAVFFDTFVLRGKYNQ